VASSIKGFGGSACIFFWSSVLAAKSLENAAFQLKDNLSRTSCFYSGVI
jgi:hypothetical protein